MARERLILKRASASRPPGNGTTTTSTCWRMGIFKANAAPVGSPWMWTLAFGHHENRTPTHGLCREPRGRDGRLPKRLARE
jgi:hypothetical protein